MTNHPPLHRPPHARIDHDAVHRATLRATLDRSPIRTRRFGRRRAANRIVGSAQ